MSGDEAKINWSVERRLEFIEFRLSWDGGVRRSDIKSTFQVSEPQASKDLTLYQERAPGNAVYDKNLKRYVAGEAFRPVFLKGGPDEYLTRLRSLGEHLTDPAESWIGQQPEVDIVVTPAREVSDECLRVILSAYRRSASIEVLYQSMSADRPEPLWRRITIHAFGYDGFRWHARAFCHLTERFKDFLLPRIIGARDMGAAGKPGADDYLWQEHFAVRIAPHPDLSGDQKAIVARDYGMTDGSSTLKVRYAMLFYVLKRLNLLGEPEKLPARSQHIVLANREEAAVALRKADFAL
ncbi:WYL domain-containing protein [Sphingomonas sp. CFBP 13706]|uniref:WYL domain-containing protein n=1 Tax=Sphingomonas sp. CFBP 13706 TaxID=2775314 RepID=UPI0017845AC1|nr:WYL domain-containing protein [Sphingomonas sp. CFBP 13706]MBD8736861.1 transcriptional regulator [Sphingomonas sp. CFBP 13706]